ncbi:MAG: S46 family peptidase, partial [Ignavibacteria bacterium]|nr:S46 family peptidase [Ignavibacteria bacterium]
MRKLYVASLILMLFAFILPLQAQLKVDTVKAQKYDNGKMWPFDYPPVEYLKETYDLKTDEAWYEDVRLSALRLPG